MGAQQALAVFLGLAPVPGPAEEAPEVREARFGVARYAVYRVHGGRRHQSLEPAHLPDAFWEYCRQGVAGISLTFA